MSNTSVSIRSIQTGRVELFGTGKHKSAIIKQRVTVPVLLSHTGLEGDEQADKRHHGGKEMALHQYPFEHYEAWQRDYPESSDLFVEPGMFGENITTLGMTEESVCIGDIYRIGSAIAQVSQGRQPCWKLNVRFKIADMAMKLQETGRTGWYYRVLEPGFIAEGDEIRLEERPNNNWPIARVLHFLNEDCLCERSLRDIASIKELSNSWSRIFERRLSRQKVEDWSSRVLTPDGEE
ncbi:MAG: MOSC domain-containing protein [Deltaproteobacteria bacterium]|nr:MOSC domain-containing protein [Deltaproteobacteria bacterium]